MGSVEDDGVAGVGITRGAELVELEGAFVDDPPTLVAVAGAADGIALVVGDHHGATHAELRDATGGDVAVHRQGAAGVEESLIGARGSELQVGVDDESTEARHTADVGTAAGEGDGRVVAGAGGAVQGEGSTTEGEDARLEATHGGGSGDVDDFVAGSGSGRHRDHVAVDHGGDSVGTVFHETVAVALHEVTGEHARNRRGGGGSDRRLGDELRLRRCRCCSGPEGSGGGGCEDQSASAAAGSGAGGGTGEGGGGEEGVAGAFVDQLDPRTAVEGDGAHRLGVVVHIAGRFGGDGGAVEIDRHRVTPAVGTTAGGGHVLEDEGAAGAKVDVAVEVIRRATALEEIARALEAKATVDVDERGGVGTKGTRGVTRCHAGVEAEGETP